MKSQQAIVYYWGKTTVDLPVYCSCLSLANHNSEVVYIRYNHSQVDRKSEQFAWKRQTAVAITNIMVQIGCQNGTFAKIRGYDTSM